MTPYTKTSRHLDFFQHQAYLTARVVRTKCDDCGVRLVNVPWARPGSGFTLLFEALVMAMISAMPMNAAQGARHAALVSTNSKM
jgi:transposase